MRNVGYDFTVDLLVRVHKLTATDGQCILGLYYNVYDC